MLDYFTCYLTLNEGYSNKRQLFSLKLKASNHCIFILNNRQKVIEWVIIIWYLVRLIINFGMNQIWHLRTKVLKFFKWVYATFFPIS